ncbi:MAG TPA: hypothetical protein VIY48_00340 [Candidatus Paceibacterota bacterium]
MAVKSVTMVLTHYFNEGEGKRDSKAWLQELKALTPEEKLELAEGVCAITGDTIK